MCPAQEAGEQTQQAECPCSVLAARVSSEHCWMWTPNKNTKVKQLNHVVARQIPECRLVVRLGGSRSPDLTRPLPVLLAPTLSLHP